MPGNDADLKVLITAVDRTSKQLDGITAALRRTERTSKQAATGIAGFNQRLTNLTTKARAAVAGIVAIVVATEGLRRGIGATIGAAIDFESSFAGIRKTMELTEAEFGKLEQANRDLAKSLPVSVNEFNRIGELAGQLGVRGVANVVKFEETIAQLAITTNLTAEDAALSFAQIANVLKLPISEVDRLASAIVALGNDTKTLETKIVDFSQRIAGAGSIVGLTTAEVAGIGAAFASAGIEAEAGGTSVQKVLLAIHEAAITGGEGLEVMLLLTGLTAEAFRDLQKDDPTEVFVRFIEGLKQSGDDAIRVLAALGLENERVRRAFLGVANAQDDVRSTVELSTAAYEENTAAAAETAKRVDTMSSQLKLAANRWADLALTVGQKAEPAVRLFAKSMSGLATDLQFVIDHLDLIAVVLLATSAIITGPIGPIAAVVLLGARWESIFNQLPGPVQSATIAVAASFDTMVNAIIGALNDAAGAIDSFLGGVDKVLGALSGGKLGVSGRIGTIGFQTNVAGALGGAGALTEDDIFALLKGAGKFVFDLGKNVVATLAEGVEPEGGGIPGLGDLLDRLLGGAGGGGASGAAAKLAEEADEALTLVDALADGIIDLSEAIELGLSRSAVALLELAHENEEFANRAFRAGVQLEKISSRLAGGAVNDLRLTFEAFTKAQEAEAERLQAIRAATTGLRAVYIEELTAVQALKDGHLLLLESQLAAAEARQAERAQLIALEVLLGEQGLAGKAAIFRNALVNLDEGFRRASESVLGFVQRLAEASTRAVQTAFDSLFRQPTQESAALDLRLAQLQLQRQRLFSGGRTEDELAQLLAPIDEEIAEINAEIDLRRAHNKVLQATAVVADQTLLTDKELLGQSNLLIGAISIQTGLLDELNTKLAFQQIRTIGVTDALDAFADALAAARDILPVGLVSGAAAASSSGTSAQLSVTVNAGGGIEDIKRAVSDALDRQLRDAGLAGNTAGAGAFT